MQDAHPFALHEMGALITQNEPGVTMWYPGQPVNIKCELTHKKDLAKRRGFNNSGLFLLEGRDMSWFVVVCSKVDPQWFLRQVESDPITKLVDSSLRYNKSGCVVSLGSLKMGEILKKYPDPDSKDNWLYQGLRPRLLPGTLCQHERADLFYIRFA